MVKLSFSAIYVINKVKLARLIQGISARQLSLDITNNQDEYVISRHESTAYKTQYPHYTLILIAKVLNCDVREFYPSDEVLLENDGSRFVKEIISLSNIDDCTLVINEMIDAGCFNDGMSFEETSIHLHEQGKPNSLVIEQALKAAEKANKLSLRNGKYYS